MSRNSVACVLTVCLVAGAVLADVPQLTNYQGKLIDSHGLPVSAKLLLGFGFFDAPTLGDRLYYEEQMVVAENGIFHVLIGNGSA